MTNVKTPVDKSEKPTIDPASIPPYQEPEQYCKLGNHRKEHQPDGIFHLVMKDFMTPIDPNTYFITSGEAIAKAEKLEKDIWTMAGKARQLKNLLKQARGPAVYLETEWNDGRLLLKRKNPRNPKTKEGKEKD